MRAERPRGNPFDRLSAEMAAERTGVMTGRMRLQRFLEGLEPHVAREALALLYLGRDDTIDWPDAVSLAAKVSSDALVNKCLESFRSRTYIRDGIEKRA